MRAAVEISNSETEFTSKVTQICVVTSLMR